MDFRSAVYYPHTKLQSSSLLKRSLLLWDRVEFISPHQGYKPKYRGRSIARAIDGSVPIDNRPTRKSGRRMNTSWKL